MRVSRRFEVDPQRTDDAAVEAAVAALRGGGLVVFPTETFYGIAADAASGDACRRVFEAKGRPASKALPVVAADLAQAERFTASFPALARRLAARFWPGPLSLVLDAAPGIAAASEDGTIAVRVSGLPLARRLPDALGRPVTATSANRTGEAPAATWPEVEASLRGAGVAVVLDGGPCPGGKPSTLVDVRSDPPRLLREGAVPMEAVLRALSEAASP